MRYLLLIIGISVAVVTPLGYRALTEANKAKLQAESAQNMGDKPSAIGFYNDCARWQLPFNDTAYECASRSLKLIREVDQTSRINDLNELKGSILGSRSFIQASNSKIQALLGEISAELTSIDPKLTNSPVKDLREPVVNFQNQAFAQLAFWGWILMVGLLIARGFDNTGQWNLKRGIGPLIGAVALYMAWLVVL